MSRFWAVSDIDGDELQEFGAKQDMEGALGHVDKALESGKFSGENKQKALLMKVSILANMGKFDDSLKFLEEAKAAAPDSEIAGQLDGFKAQLEQAKAGAAGGGEKQPAEEGKEETEK